MSNNDDSTRISLLATHPEDSEYIKYKAQYYLRKYYIDYEIIDKVEENTHPEDRQYVDDNIIGETQGKLAEVEFNTDDD